MCDRVKAGSGVSGGRRGSILRGIGSREGDIQCKKQGVGGVLPKSAKQLTKLVSSLDGELFLGLIKKIHVMESRRNSLATGPLATTCSEFLASTSK